MINQRSLQLLNRYISLFLLIGCLTACNNNEGELFRMQAVEKTGLNFQNTLTETDNLNILDYLYFYNGGGVAIGDINNDGLLDIYLSGNQVKNKLYLNKGGLNFEDITEKAGVAGLSTWNTGAVMGDVNGDGLLDIYVCAVVGLNGFNGHNELYINNGDLSFTESSAQYNLDLDAYSSSAGFLDYDLDGDLDMYILNHAVHSQESFGKAELRFKRNAQTGDRLMRNDGGSYTDVSEQAGIYGGVNGYGLGLAIADFNLDGFPDIYVGNDFHEDDYYYINNGNGTFKESLKDYFGHTSRFSMGNDVADLNHDGRPDILSLDMLAEDEKVLKSSEGDDNVQTLKMRIERFGYHYQFTRNMLYINQEDGNYVERALQSGIAATDWSWSGLFADFDQDGEQDLFVSNGIPKRPNNLDFINFVSDEQIKKKINNTKLVDQQALDLMPSGAVNNYIFQGSNNLHFKDRSADWIPKDTLISGATAMGDLDNDGDLDLVVNNINSPVALYENKTNTSANYLKVQFKFTKPNSFGLGTKVFSYSKGQLQAKELYTVRGFQASSAPILHFGYKQATQVDSIKVIWPDKSYQTLRNVAVNQTLTLSPEQVKAFDYNLFYKPIKKIFTKVANNLGIDFKHNEDNYLDFNRQKLIPYRVSDRGPATAIGDLNNDNKEDIFFGGSKYIPSKIYFAADSTFVETTIEVIKNDSIKEDVAALIADLNGDQKNDLFVASGGADFNDKMKPLLDSYYLQNESAFINSLLPEYFENASVIRPFDFDQDGDLDLFVASSSASNDFGKIPNCYLLVNDNGQFSILENTPFQEAGLITDATWDDFDGDGQKDLILVGEWMQPRFFKNNKGLFLEKTPLKQEIKGLWQGIMPFDIDGDGDMDYVLGNWGLNSKFKASVAAPLKMYYADFDQNGNTETLVCIEKKGVYYPLLGLDELAGQIVSLKKKFTTYKDFAGKSIAEILDKETLKKAKLFEVTELRSGVLINENGSFNFNALPDELQVAPIRAFLKGDFDNDKKLEVLAAGNYFGVTPFHGRFDSFAGALIKGENNVILGPQIGLDLSKKSVRHLNLIHFKHHKYLLVTINNDHAEVYKILDQDE